jgi:hypothetical protein
MVGMMVAIDSQQGFQAHFEIAVLNHDGTISAINLVGISVLRIDFSNGLKGAMLWRRWLFHYAVRQKARLRKFFSAARKPARVGSSLDAPNALLLILRVSPSSTKR